MTAPLRDATRVSASVRRRRFVVVASVAAAVDLASKATASALLPRHLVDLPGPLDLRLSHNPGIAFGLGDAVPAWLLLALTATVVVFLAVVGWRDAFTSTTGAGLVLGGAVANVADRLQAGTVVDRVPRTRRRAGAHDHPVARRRRVCRRVALLPARDPSSRQALGTSVPSSQGTRRSVSSRSPSGATRNGGGPGGSASAAPRLRRTESISASSPPAASAGSSASTGAR